MMIESASFCQAFHDIHLGEASSRMYALRHLSAGMPSNNLYQESTTRNGGEIISASNAA